MIDFETELRERLDRTADHAPTGEDLLAEVERRIAAGDRRTTLLRVAAVAVVVLGLVGVVAGLAGRDDGETTITTEPDAPTSTTAPPPPSTVPGPGWAPMAAAPIEARSQFLALDLDGEVLVWGGYGLEGDEPLTDGAIYRPASDTWAPVSASPLDFGGGPIAAWTGEEAIVLVQDHDSESPTDGDAQAAAYDPATDTWRRLTDPSGEVSFGDAVSSVVWTGTEVLAVTEGADRDDGSVAAYDPAADTWRTTAAPPVPIPSGDAVWTGTELVVVGRGLGPIEGPDAPGNQVIAYDPTADSWREIPWGLDGAGREEMVVAWTGERIFVGGGYALDSASTTPLTDAALLDPGTGEWTAVADAPHPFEGNWRGRETWTGSEVLTLPSLDGILAVAQLFDPATGTWRVDESSSPVGANQESPWVMSGNRVVFPLIGDPRTGGGSYQP